MCAEKEENKIGPEVTELKKDDKITEEKVPVVVPITNMHPNSLSQHLIKCHTIGDIRDENDFRNIIYHCGATISVIKDTLTNFTGTNEEKVTFLDKVIEDLGKFQAITPEEVAKRGIGKDKVVNPETLEKEEKTEKDS